jgi:heme-degrading monooxygenase HmoA
VTVSYTSGVWQVKPGEEDDFVAAWEQFAEWAAAQHGSGTLRLTRDRDVDGRFFSFAPWASIEQAHAWKSSPEFSERMARVQQHVAQFAPSELDLVTEVGSG